MPPPSPPPSSPPPPPSPAAPQPSPPPSEPPQLDAEAWLTSVAGIAVAAVVGAFFALGCCIAVGCIIRCCLKPQRNKQLKVKPGRDDSGYAMTYDDETKRKLDEARAGKAAADEKAEEAQRIATRALAEAASSRELVTQLSQRLDTSAIDWAALRRDSSGGEVKPLPPTIQQVAMLNSATRMMQPGRLPPQLPPMPNRPSPIKRQASDFVAAAQAAAARRQSVQVAPPDLPEKLPSGHWSAVRPFAVPTDTARQMSFQTLTPADDRMLRRQPTLEDMMSSRRSDGSAGGGYVDDGAGASGGRASVVMTEVDAPMPSPAAAAAARQAPLRLLPTGSSGGVPFTPPRAAPHAAPMLPTRPAPIPGAALPGARPGRAAPRRARPPRGARAAGRRPPADAAALPRGAAAPRRRQRPDRAPRAGARPARAAGEHRAAAGDAGRRAPVAHARALGAPAAPRRAERATVGAAHRAVAADAPRAADAERGVHAGRRGVNSY